MRRAAWVLALLVLACDEPTAVEPPTCPTTPTGPLLDADGKPAGTVAVGFCVRPTPRIP